MNDEPKIATKMLATDWWAAEIPGLPGMSVYASTEADAIENAQITAKRMAAKRDRVVVERVAVHPDGDEP